MELDVRHIAELAKLDVPEEKLDEIGEEMAAIMKMVENLPPLESAGALINAEETMPLREDVVRPSLGRGAILQNAPEAADGCFVVPKTVE